MIVKRLEAGLLEIELPGEDHSIANLIVRLALEKQGVEYASYTVDHPLIGTPRIIIRTTGKTEPLDVLREVLEDIRGLSREFADKLGEQLGSEG